MNKLSSNMAGPNDQWEQYYQKTFMDNGLQQQATPNINGGLSSDSTIVTTSSTVVTENMKIHSPSSSYNTANTTPTSSSSGQLTPTGSVSKPIRRRSRVSKKTPITLLNANANNFRSLVQQFTGCVTASAPLSFGNQKGPINLSFGLNNATNAGMAPFGNNYNSNSYHQYQQLQQHVQQQQLEQKRQPLLQLQENQQLHQEQQQQCMYPTFDNITGGYNPMALETVDGVVMDQEDIALNDFFLPSN